MTPFFANQWKPLAEIVLVTCAAHCTRHTPHACVPTSQAFEYYEAALTMSDGYYGSAFYTATGFHGLHVIIGTTFLFVCALRMARGQFAPTHHLGFQLAAWYWHFVDVVWLFVLITFYDF